MTTIEDVISRMMQIDAALPAGDGVKQFNALYLTVTRAISAARSTFENWPAVERLDVVFAGFYFQAVSAATAGGDKLPRAWRPLFARRSDSRIVPLQFALAGMNAHINHDLLLAVVQTLQELGQTIADDTPFHRDYERVNDILAQVEAETKPQFIPPELREIDGLLQHLDDVVAMWNICAARDAAWANSHVLWLLRGTLAERLYLDTLDRSVGMSSRGLVIPLL